VIPAQPTDDDEKRPASVRGGHQRRRSLVRSSDGVVGHIFRTVGEYGYFAGRFNAFTATFKDPNLERLKKRIVASRRMSP
jgi:hypothetical protein